MLVSSPSVVLFSVVEVTTCHILLVTHSGDFVGFYLSESIYLHFLHCYYFVAQKAQLWIVV